MPDKISLEESKKIFKKYKELIQKIPKSYAVKQITQSFHRDYRTVYQAIRDETQIEVAKLEAQLIKDVLEGKKFDWNSLVPYATHLLFDSLCVKKDLNAAKFVLTKIDKPSKNGNKPKEEQKVF